MNGENRNSLFGGAAAPPYREAAVCKYAKPTSEEILAVAMLKLCRFAPASWDKRFVRDIDSDRLTEKQKPQVWRLFVRYRRQIQPHFCTRVNYGVSFETMMETAQRLAAPDFRKLAKQVKV